MWLWVSKKESFSGCFFLQKLYRVFPLFVAVASSVRSPGVFFPRTYPMTTTAARQQFSSRSLDTWSAAPYNPTSGTDGVKPWNPCCRSSKGLMARTKNASKLRVVFFFGGIKKQKNSLLLKIYNINIWDVSENRGNPPKSSILIGCSHYFHHPFWGVVNTPILVQHQVILPVGWFWGLTWKAWVWPWMVREILGLIMVRHAEFQHLGFGRHGTTGLHWRLGYGATDARRKIAAVQCGGNFPWSMLKRCLKVSFVFLFSSFQLWSMFFFIFCYLSITRCLEICLQDFRSRFAATARSSTTMETHLSTPSPCNSRQGWGD